MKKRLHNKKRNPQRPPSPPPTPAPAAPTPPVHALPPAGTSPPQQSPSSTSAEPQFDPAMVKHLIVATSLIEGRKVTRQEILEMLQRKMRQPSMAPDPPAGYGGGDVKQPPP